MSKNLKIINLGGYEIPKVIENKRHNWVEYGENNQYFDEIIERYLGSATNSRCVNGIVDMIYGRGLDATDSQEKAEMFGKMQSILKPDQLKRIVNDLKLLGQASIQVTYDKKKSQINGIYHFPTETLRAEKAKDGKVKGYYYHPKWSEIKPNDKPKRIPAFGYGSKKELIEIYCVKPYRPGFYYYSPVDYQGCLQYCNLEEEVSNYHIQNIKNASQYINSIEKNNLAVLRGYSVNKEQKIIREIINSIMCNYFVDINIISKKYNLTNSELYNSIKFKEDSLEDFISDKILDFNDNKITINESGRLFTRNIAMRFDPLIDQKIGTYSNTV